MLKLFILMILPVGFSYLMGISYGEKESIFYFIFISVGMLLDYLEDIGSSLSRIISAEGVLQDKDKQSISRND